MRYIIGIDDTDNLESRGTGHRSRMLGLGLMEASLCKLENITRHQLIVSLRIPYPLHSTSARLLVSNVTDIAGLMTYCKVFLLLESDEN